MGDEGALSITKEEGEGGEEASWEMVTTGGGVQWFQVGGGQSLREFVRGLWEFVGLGC